MLWPQKLFYWINTIETDFQIGICKTDVYLPPTRPIKSVADIEGEGHDKINCDM